MLLFFILLLRFQAEAQTDALGWKELRALVLEKNPELKSQRYRFEASRIDYRSSFSGFVPSLSAYVNHSETDLEARGGHSDLRQDSWGLSTSYTFFSGFSGWYGVKRANASQESAQLDLRIKEADLRSRLRTAYITALSGVSQVSLAERVLERRRENLKLMKQRYDSGAEAIWSLQQTEVDVENARLSVLEDSFNRDQALADLGRLMDMDPKKIVLRDEVSEMLQTKSSSFALTDHPRYKQLQSESAIADFDIKLAQADYYPKISGYITWDQFVPDSGWPSYQRYYFISADIPIFSGLSTFHRVQKANASKYSTEHLRANTERTLQSAYDKALQTYDLRLQAIAIADNQLRAANARATTVTSQFKLGLRKYFEWEDAQDKLIEAEREVVRVRREALLALATLEQASGIGLE